MMEQAQQQITRRAAQQALALLASGRGQDRCVQDADGVSGPAQPGHEVQIFHDRNGGEPAQGAENLGPDEDGLVAVGDAGPAGAEGGQGGDDGQSATGRVVAQAEGSAADSGIAQGAPDEVQAVGGEDGVGVQKK